MIRLAGWLAVVLGLALLLVPVRPHGGTWSDGGPAATAVLRLTEPSDADRFIPSYPGAHIGASAAVEYQGKAFSRLLIGIPLLIAGTLATMWHRRRRSRRGVSQQKEEGATATV